jgi:hypothetical protein
MTIFPICLDCKHLSAGDEMTCAAFPDGIPTPILVMTHDHHEPYPGDHGIRFEPKASEKPKEQGEPHEQ